MMSTVLVMGCDGLVEEELEIESMSTQHTPTPWSVHPVCILEYALKNGVPVGHPLSYEPGGFQIFTDDGRGNGLPLPEDDREANAAHIVRCVNSHDALVEALKAIIEDSTNIGIGKEARRQLICERAQAALEAAGEA